MMNVYFGGTLHQDIKDISGCNHDDWQRRSTGNHKVTVCPETKLSAILGCESFTVNSLHHQAVDTPAPVLTVAARAEDGIIEAVEHPLHPFCIGVQWHPEWSVEEGDDSFLVFFTDLMDHTGLGEK